MKSDSDHLFPILTAVILAGVIMALLAKPSPTASAAAADSASPVVVHIQGTPVNGGV